MKEEERYRSATLFAFFVLLNSLVVGISFIVCVYLVHAYNCELIKSFLLCSIHV